MTDYRNGPGSDLNGELEVLSANLTAAVPSFLGLTMTVIVDGFPVILTAVHTDLASTAHAGLRLPISGRVPAETGGSVVFYAADPDAFVDLAADHRWAAGAERVAGADLPCAARPARPLGVSGLTELATYHQAIGALIVDGYHPDTARTELRRRTARDNSNLPEAAHRVLDSITEPAGAPCSDLVIDAAGSAGTVPNSLVPNIPGAP